MTSGIRFNSGYTALPIMQQAFGVRQLLLTCALARMGTGLIRIGVNWHAARNNPRLSRQEKASSTLERVFMEGVGVPFHLSSLYFIQDVTAKLFERLGFLKRPTALGLSQLTAKQQQVINNVLAKKIFPENTPKPHGVIAQQIYHPDVFLKQAAEVKGELAKALRVKTLPQQVANNVEWLLKRYHTRLTMATAGTIGAAVLVSAYLSGYFMQWMNDTVIARRVIPWILRVTGISAPSSQDQAERTFRI